MCVAFIAMQNTAIRLCLKYNPNDDTRRRNKKRVEVFYNDETVREWLIAFPNIPGNIIADLQIAWQ